MKLAILGAGTMGTGLAEISIRAGFQTLLFDTQKDALNKSIQQIEADFNKLIERGKLTDLEKTTALQKLEIVTTLKTLKDVDFLIEAVPENLELKQNLFLELENINSKAIFATNTSTLSVSAICAKLKNKHRLVGMHFFNPPTILPLVEIIKSAQSNQETIDITFDLAKKLGKTPVLTKDTPGFIVNRVARPFYGEALHLLSENGDVSTIDKIMRGSGFAMGPFELMDLIGLDINLAATKSVFEAFFFDSKYRPHPIQQIMVDAGLLGRKTKKGFYDYK